MRLSGRHAVLFWLAALLGVVVTLGPVLHGMPAGLRLSAAPAGGAAPVVHAAGVARRVQRAVRRPLTANNTVLAYPPPPISARAAFLLDVGTGTVLYAKDADERLPMASTTKITTAAVVLAHARLNEMAPVSRQAATVGESTMALVQGERLSVRDLLYGLLLNSGNDAAIALAQRVGGSVAHFVGMMNQLAHDLGMRNTHYTTPHGLDAPHHYSSARDLATMALYALRDRTFRQIVATENYHIPATRHNHEHWLANVNRVMYWFPGVDGVKPGQTDAAGLCQVVSAWRNGHHLLAVLLNTPTLVFDIRNLLDYGSRDFHWEQAPAYWDTPNNMLAGGKGTLAWRYYYGAGHYLRGAFLHYFDAHGGLTTFGYPRTEQLRMANRVVQFFQGGELVRDPATHRISPAPLGQEFAVRLAPRSLWAGARVTPGFAGAYRGFGGARVLGPPISGTTTFHGATVQFFRQGAISEAGGSPHLIPLGDLALRRLGWLPAAGTANAMPSTLADSLDRLP